MHRFLPEGWLDRFDGFPRPFRHRSLPAYLWLTGLLLLGTEVYPAQAQQRPEPFSTITLSVAGTQNLNRNFLHTFWKPGTGAEGRFSTPFYLGFVEVGGALHRYRADGDVPDFDALLLYAGWGLGADVVRQVRVEGSVRVGNYRMTFDDNTFAGVRTESELALMAQARLSLRPVGPVSFFAAGSYLQAYTFVRLKLWYASAGLSVRLRSPGWLQEVLR